MSTTEHLLLRIAELMPANIALPIQEDMDSKNFLLLADKKFVELLLSTGHLFRCSICNSCAVFLGGFLTSSGWSVEATFVLVQNALFWFGSFLQ
jgi:hypothetical protein